MSEVSHGPKGSFARSTISGVMSSVIFGVGSYLALSLALDALSETMLNWLFYGIPVVGAIVGVALRRIPGMRSFGNGWLWGFLLSVAIILAASASFS